LTLRPGKSSRKAGTKGQLYGYAIKIKTGKPWVAKPDRKTCYATGQFRKASLPAETDEDENLVGAGSLGRGEPTYQFFDTLEYRVGNPERELS
jgi:hypothetical protein